MKLFKHIITLGAFWVATLGFSQQQRMIQFQDSIPFSIKEIQYQKIVSDSADNSSDVAIFLSLQDQLPDGVSIEAVHFEGKIIKLEPSNGDKLNFKGQYVSQPFDKATFVMSADPKDEYGNTLPIRIKPSPFQLNKNECVISYKVHDLIFFTKVNTIHQKEAL